MSKKKKILIISGAVILVIVFVVMNFTMNTTQGLEVKAETAKTRELVEQVSASGRIQPQTKVDITSEVTGEIIALMAKEGDFVETGQMLIILDTVQLQSDFDQARYAMNEIEARLEGAKISLDQAKEDYELQQELLKDNLTSEIIHRNAKYAYLNAEASLTAMKAQGKQFQARLDKQRDYLSKAKITAPMPGIVTYLDCEVGEIAPAQTGFTQGRTLMIISNLDVFEVEVEVDETEINKVELGQVAEIEVDAFTDTVFAGTIVEIGNTALLSGSSQDQSTNFKVKVIFEDANVKIRPGMSATVDIITNKHEDALTVPYSAIVMRSFDADSLEQAKAGNLLATADDSDSDDNSTSVVSEVQAAEVADTLKVEEDKDESERVELKGVFVIRDGKAKFIEVSTGIADQKYIEISSGLIKGDSVISGPYRILRTVKDGEDVKTGSNQKEN